MKLSNPRLSPNATLSISALKLLQTQLHLFTAKLSQLHLVKSFLSLNSEKISKVPRDLNQAMTPSWANQI